MLKMQEKITRRKVLGLLEEAVLGTSVFIASGCAVRKKRTFVISEEALRVLSSEFPNFSQAEEGTNNYTTKMVYSNKGVIFFRKSESEKRELVRGELVRWDSESRFLFKGSRDVNQVSSYDISSGNVEVVPHLASFPVLSPNGKRFLEVVGEWITLGRWREGKLYSYNLAGGSSPRWFNDEALWYISFDSSLKLSDSKVLPSELCKLSDLCKGFDISTDRREVVYTEIFPAEVSEDKTVRGYTRLCYANLGDLKDIMESIRLCQEKIENSNDAGEYIRLCQENLENSKTKNKATSSIQGSPLCVRESSAEGLAEFLGPKISPDGKNIAFVEAYGQSLENMNILVYNREEKASKEIKSGLNREISMPYERIIEWLDDSENLAVSYEGNKISVFNIETGKSHTFSGTNASVYHN